MAGGKGDDKENLMSTTDIRIFEEDMTYIDARGCEMHAIPYSEALSKVLGLAHDAARSGEPEADAARAVLSGLLPHLGGSLDAILAYPAEAGTWDEAVWKLEPGADPASPANAIRICLVLAETAAIDPEDTERDIELADECDQEQMAFDLVRDLLGLHGATLDATVSALRADAEPDEVSDEPSAALRR
jgi:hypothetical protein